MMNITNVKSLLINFAYFLGHQVEKKKKSKDLLTNAKSYVFCGTIIAFWTVFRGQSWLHWYVDDHIYDKKNLTDILLLLKEDNIKKHVCP